MTTASAMRGRIFFILTAVFQLLQPCWRRRRDQWLSIVVVNVNEKDFAIVEGKSQQKFLTRVTKKIVFPSRCPL